MRKPDYIIKIAADSVDKLRRSDIERVLENCSDEELQPTTDYILAHRPDYAAKIEAELDYQFETRRETVSTTL
jgi:hypothetical protein